MNKKELMDLINKKYVVLDGATGTFLQKEGMPAGACPEMWAIENPAVTKKIHSAYAGAGSDIIYTCTFGANRIKLKTYGLENRVEEINYKLVRLAKETAGENVFVAGSIGPTGKFIEPVGDLPFDEAVDVFARQIKGMADAGADLLVIETMMDIQEARAALIAAKQTCGLAVMVSMTFAQDNRTLTGTDPVSALITLQSLGADVVGTNCGFGPDKMLDIIKLMVPYAQIPLMAKPNAGLPVLRNGETAYNMTPCEFSEFVPEFIECGIRFMGGCCGTSPEYVAMIHRNFKDKNPDKFSVQCTVEGISSRSKTVFFETGKPLAIIGERINPTGKKVLSEELINGKMTELKRLAGEQAQAGAQILDVNVGVPSIDEKKTMREAVFSLTGYTDLPLCIDSSNAEVIEEALKHYPGRALVNSLSAESEKINKLIPVLKKYGAMFVLLPVDDKGVPETAAERIEIIEKTIAILELNGIPARRAVVDGITMTVSSMPQAPEETLKTIKYCTGKKLLTTAGLSNVSFGLPERKWVNNAFLAMAVSHGLSSAILNPCDEQTMNILSASCVLAGRDKNALSYIKRFQQGTVEKKEVKTVRPVRLDCRQALIQGDKDTLLARLEEELRSGREPLSIINESLVPAMQEVGIKFNRKEYFLPQLMLSAEAMQDAFAYLKPYLGKGSSHSIGRMIMATVKGDIHDIGKNMVTLMLRNHGIEVIDLGKDVSADTILSTAQKEKINVIGLSALMTTTMTEMETVIKDARSAGLDIKFMVGGAVITAEYAKKIGADGYAKDSVEAVDIAKSFFD